MSVEEKAKFHSWEELVWRPWYCYGKRSPWILFARFRNGHHALFHPTWRPRMMWQRAQRGYSIEDAWGLSGHLSRVIAESVETLITELHGYPSTGHWDEEQGKYVDGPLTFEGWKQILQEIVEGMRAAERHFNGYYTEDHEWWEQEGEAKFHQAMDHLKEWWFALWD